ncbi:hypothetical protein ACSLPA_34245, partial [Escherichia coli]
MKNRVCIIFGKMSKLCCFLHFFSRNGKLGFEPEGSYQQFNDVFAEMVAWHNAAGITGNGHFTI